jgi:hypothetical protein
MTNDEIHFQTTYKPGSEYEEIKLRAKKYLSEYLEDPAYKDIYRFDNDNSSVTFLSERLVPRKPSGKKRVMLLFSNPHPHSILQGMFLSPNRKNARNQFWPTMKDAGFFPFISDEHGPKELKEIFQKNKYKSDYEYIFSCYYAFPTDYPDHIKKIFGPCFKNYILPQDEKIFRAIIEMNDIRAVITFNKDIYNLITENKIKPLLKLKNGEIISNAVQGVKNRVTIFYTFPTGWRYAKDWKRLRVENLKMIYTEIKKQL